MLTDCTYCTDCSDCTSPTNICGFITDNDEVTSVEDVKQLDLLRKQLESLIRTVDERRADLLNAAEGALESEEERLKSQLTAIQKLRAGLPSDEED